MGPDWRKTPQTKERLHLLSTDWVEKQGSGAPYSKWQGPEGAVGYGADGAHKLDTSGCGGSAALQGGGTWCHNSHVPYQSKENDAPGAVSPQTQTEIDDAETRMELPSLPSGLMDL